METASPEAGSRIPVTSMSTGFTIRSSAETTPGMLSIRDFRWSGARVAEAKTVPNRYRS